MLYNFPGQAAWRATDHYNTELMVRPDKCTGKLCRSGVNTSSHSDQITTAECSTNKTNIIFGMGYLVRLRFSEKSFPCMQLRLVDIEESKVDKGPKYDNGWEEPHEAADQAVGGLLL